MATSRSLSYWQGRVLLCTMGCYLFYYTGRLVIGHALPLMEQDLGYTKEELGWLTATLFFAYGTGQAINGNLGDWLGGRRMMALGAVGSMLVCWAFSFMHTLAWLLVLWAVNGYVQSMGWAPGSRLLSNWWPRRQRGLAFGLYLLAAGLAAVLVWMTSYAVLAMLSTEDPARWRWLFRVPVLALGAAGVVFYLLVRERPEDVGLDGIEPEVTPNGHPTAGEADPPRSAYSIQWIGRYAHVTRDWRFLLACLVIMLQSFARYGLLTWIVIYYKDSGIDLKDSLLITLSLPIGMGIGAFAGGYASDRLFQSRRTIVVCLFLVISAACCLVLWATPVSAESDKALGIASLFFAGFFVFGAQGPLWALCPDLVGKAHTGTAVGVMNAVAYMGAAAQGPILGYFISHPDRYGYPAVFLLLSLMCGISASLAVVIRR